MANSIEEILGRQINSVKELKSAIKELQDSLIGVDADSEQFKTTTDQLAAAQAELNKVTKAGKDDNNAAADSIRGMEQEYKKLYDTYKQLSEEQRNSDIGKSMAESLETLSTKINETKKDVGNFKDNIGRYAQSASEAFNGMGVSIGGLQTPLKLATGGAKTFGTALKTLAANPIVLIITALVAILVKAAEAIKKNEELTNRLQQAFSVFRPVLDAVANAFDFLAGLLVKTVEGLSKVAEKILSIIPGMKQAIQSHKDLEKATQNLTKATREANIENSKKQAEIERLREEASATEDVVEKKKLLEEAKAMQNEIDQTNIALAQEELRIMQEYGDKTANSAEENEKLAAAQKKVNDAIAQGERNQRMYNKQLDATTNKTKAATSSATDYRKKATELYNQLVEDSKTEIQQLTEKYEKEKKLLEKYHLDTTLLTKKYNKEVEKVRKDADKRLRDNAVNIINETERIATEVASKLDQSKTVQMQAEKLEKLVVPVLQSLTREGVVLKEAYKKVQEEGLVSVEEALDTFRDAGYMDIAGDLEAWISVLDDAAVSGRLAAEDVEKMKAKLADIGQEKFKDITGEIGVSVKYLKDFFGITVENSEQAELQLKAVVLQIKELKTQAADLLADINLDAVRKAAEEASLYLNTSAILNGSSQSEVNQEIAKNNYDNLMNMKVALEEELKDFQGSYEKKLEILREYYATVAELRQADFDAEALQLQRTEEIWDAAFDHFDAWTSSLDSVLGAIENVMQAEIDSGKLTKKEADKKKRVLEALEQVQLGVAIANIAANTAAGIMDVWRGYAAELPVNAQTAAATGPAAAATKAALDGKSLATAIIRTTAIGAQGTAQLAAAIGGYIAKTTAAASEDSSGSVGVATTPTLIDSTPYSYTRTVQSQEEYDALNRPIWVSVEDISNGLGHQVSVRDESSF